jgi:O-antigen ligase
MNPTLRARLHDTRGLFSTQAADIDKATAYRLTLWRTGARIFADHRLIGIGPRGFRHIYARYAAPDDFWIKRIGGGQTHPHQFMLEIAIETGVIGLAAFIVFYGLLLRLLARPTLGRVVPVWLLGAAVAWLPLNAHLAFYGAYWSTLAWLLLAVGLAEARAPRAPDDAALPSPSV